MRIIDLLRFAKERGEPIFSFEFFPPKTDEGVRALFETVEALRPLGPAYVCVTYGAGGSTRERTVELVKRLKHDTEVEAMAHVTCVGSSRDEIASVLDELAEAGIQNVMALRGDPPRGQASFTPHPDGFRYAGELVSFIRSQPSRWNFCLGAAAYPEGHLETRDLSKDIAHLKAKVDAGADFLVTQIFLDNAFYFAFLERARAAGIGIPVLPGIMPVQTVEQNRADDGHVRSHAAPFAQGGHGRPAQLARCGPGAGARLRHAPVRRAVALRRAGHPLLHPQPIPLDARHPGRAAISAPWRG